jgi:hypothetical protein
VVSQVPKGILTFCDVLTAPSAYHQIMHMKFDSSFPLHHVMQFSMAEATPVGHFLNAIIDLSKFINSISYCDIPPPQAPFVKM